MANREDALAIIGRWRSAHGWPLNAIKVTLRDRAVRIDPLATVAQRLKRLSSISAKLRRFEAMQLSTMQDIGGCRAVLERVEDVEALVRMYEQAHAKSPHRGNVFVKKFDYLSPPKPDGYRGVHFVYRYRSTTPKNAEWDGMKSEIQIRSRLQHAWATAVESVSTFTGQQLKSSLGEDMWKRFFALMGSAIALREGRAIVPGTPADRAELVRELRELDSALRVDSVLAGSEIAVQLSAGPEGAFYLLVLDAGQQKVTVLPFSDREQAEASTEYLEYEKEVEKNPNLNAVLVSTETMAALKDAFPNYYLDTTAFRAAMAEALDY